MYIYITCILCAVYYVASSFTFYRDVSNPFVIYNVYTVITSTTIIAYVHKVIYIYIYRYICK